MPFETDNRPILIDGLDYEHKAKVLRFIKDVMYIDIAGIVWEMALERATDQEDQWMYELLEDKWLSTMLISWMMDYPEVVRQQMRPPRR
jgi:hypothetical protein